MGPDRKVYKVGELTRLIRAALESEIGEVWLEGELSNVRCPSSGHYYFTIKDESAQINAVLFRGDQRGLRLAPKDGILVRVFGEVTVYERGGNYQIIIRHIEEAGVGALQAKFEELKEKLRIEGLFDEKRKKKIPLLPQRVGLVTSPTGAAIRDILNVVFRRFPNIHLILAPVRVQGENAAAEISAAIDLFNEMAGVDVLIVGRGGGSLEDLWCFNEEIVARAIARSRIPVISAVGHEIDFTISDFVADLRAPTPSAAAEMVIGKKEEFEDAINEISRRVSRSLRECLLAKRNRLAAAARSYVFREPENLVKQYLQRIDTVLMRIRNQMRSEAAAAHKRLDELGTRMRHEIKIKSQSCRLDLKRVNTQLDALNPLAVLDRGYSITSDETGRVITSVKGMRQGQRLSTRVAKGTFESEVVKVGENG